MQETHWLTCIHPSLLLGHLTGDLVDSSVRPARATHHPRLSAVGLLYFLAACARSDGIEHWRDYLPENRFLPGEGVDPERFFAITDTARAFATRRRPFSRGDDLDHLAQVERCEFLRDVFGNPFRPPVLVEPTWCTPDVRALALSWWQGEPTPLPILADALEEAGCQGRDCLRCGGLGWIGSISLVNDRRTKTRPCPECSGSGQSHPLLVHLRSTALHIPGCWAMELLLPPLLERNR